ncbi:DUF2857 domain-containing protein [Motilimonas eburnea]|uniref:DUF2857 domain-containing protein n=1 Tax=Motilimonas eburnea TaxID=1737488 RepID=UPI001E5FA645|nr:DUF2857 domain-containing protein [Motilimonas eburnea]MCE2573830.1 DUF2857 domain-containing protein [Motilimonas eburnea]
MNTDRDNSAAISSVLLEFMTSGCIAELKYQLKRKSMKPYQLKCDEVAMFLDELEGESLNRTIQSVLYEILSRAPVEEILNRLACKVRGEVGSCKSSILIEEYIKAGAGNVMMKDLFGYGSKRCQKERKKMDIGYFTGRYKKLDEEQELDVLNTYLSNELNEIGDMKSVIYAIHKDTKYDINGIYNCLVEYKRLEKEKKDRVRAEGYERIGTQFG